MLRKSIAILLIFSIAGCVFHADELVKIPKLPEHYFIHKTEGSLALYGGFMVNPFSDCSSATGQDDQQDDSRIPYKSDHSTVSHVGFFTMAHYRMVFVAGEMHAIHIPGYRHSGIPSLSPVWQPPRFCAAV